MGNSSFDDLFSDLHSYSDKKSPEKHGSVHNKPKVTPKNKQSSNNSKQKQPSISDGLLGNYNKPKQVIKPASKPVKPNNHHSAPSVSNNKPVINHRDKQVNPYSRILHPDKPALNNDSKQNTNINKQSNINVRDSNKKVVNKQVNKPTSKPKRKLPTVNKKPVFDDNNPTITADGKTLQDMMPHLSGDRNVTIKKDNADELIKQAKSDLSLVKRTRHIDRISDKAKQAEARRKMASKFIQKNSRYTEDEKIIMTNLGLTSKDLTDIMKLPKEKLTKGDKMKILNAGAVGAERQFKGKRFRPTRGDNDMLEFLARFKLASTRILSLIRGEPQTVTNRRLKRLKKNGLVADYDIPGLGTVWTVTEVGMALSGSDLKTYRQRRPKMSVLPPVIGINYVAACLWHNSYNVLFLNDFPANNKTMYGNDGKVWTSQGEDLISELEIRSSWGRELKPEEGQSFGVSSGVQDTLIQQAQLIWRKWDRNGRNIDSPENIPGNEYLWILFPEGGLTVSFHVPDLVIKRKRNSDGSPNSIAVECELSRKSHKNYVNTMRAYMEDKYLYKKVIWITNNGAIERRLRAAAEEIGFTNFDIVPFTNEDGIYRNRDIWYI